MDWPSLIRRIKDRGATQQQIAAMCSELGATVTQSAISDLESGKTQQPGYALGVALNKLASAKKRRPSTQGA